MNINDLKELISLCNKTSYNTIELTIDRVQLKLLRSASSNKVNNYTAPSADDNEERTLIEISPEENDVFSLLTHALGNDKLNNDENGNLIVSPISGTFRERPSQGEMPFVELGSLVREGDVIGIVEAMNKMNEITSEYNGNVVEIMVRDGEMVEFGQPMFKVL